MREWVQRQFYYFTEDDSNLLKIRFSTDFVICRDVASEETKKKNNRGPVTNPSVFIELWCLFITETKLLNLLLYKKPKVEKSVHKLKINNRIKAKTEKYFAKCSPFFVFIRR